LTFAFYSYLNELVKALPVSPPSNSGAAPIWRVDHLAGRLVELSGWERTAHLTAAFGLVLDAQLGGERAAWVTLEHSSFFPPDVADGGVDLDAMPVVRVPDARVAARAADHLVRSGGFGLVVIDLSGEAGGRMTLPVALLTRLLGLARAHETAVIVLTKKSPHDASLNSLISLRAEAQWMAGDGCYNVRIQILKDKRAGPGWTHVEACRGPAGLR